MKFGSGPVSYDAVSRSLGVGVANVDDVLVNKWDDSSSLFFPKGEIGTYGPLVSEPENVVMHTGTAFTGYSETCH